MMVKGIQRTESAINVEISVSDAVEALMRDMAYRLGIPHQVFVKDGKLYETVERHGGTHSWNDEELVLALPIPEHLEYVAVRERLYKLLEALARRDEARKKRENKL